MCSVSIELNAIWLHDPSRPSGFSKLLPVAQPWFSLCLVSPVNVAQ